MPVLEQHKNNVSYQESLTNLRLFVSTDREYRSQHYDSYNETLKKIFFTKFEINLSKKQIKASLVTEVPNCLNIKCKKYIYNVYREIFSLCYSFALFTYIVSLWMKLEWGYSIQNSK